MPEETLELETVAENLSEIEAEEGVDAYGSEYVEESETESIDYYKIAQEAIDAYVLESLEAKYHSEEENEELTLSVFDEWRQDSELYEVVSAEPLRATNPVMPEQKAYQLILDNRTVYAWFPSAAELGVTDDGYIYNETANNITGVIADSLNGVSLNSYNDTVTVTPLLTGSGNNNAYRYGSRVYTTHYYVSGNTLLNTVSYVSAAEVLQKPFVGYGFSRFQIAGLGLLFVMVVILFLRGLWRDK